MKVQRETNQAEGTIIIENIIKMSQDQTIPLTIFTKSGGTYTGIVIAVTITVGFLSGENRGMNDLLLKEGKYYNFIRYSEVETIAFEADESVFDDMLK